MKRKLIAQGKGGFTVTLPVEWVRENRLEPGAELEIVEEAGKLLISAEKAKAKPKEIALTAKDTRESAVRTLLANAYRAGFDRITLNYAGKQDVLAHIVKDHLVGFELFKKAEGKYVIESVAEPSYEDFGKIIEKQFFIILEIIRSLADPKATPDFERVQKYDNFLKRCLSKKVVTHEAFPFMWQFISDLTQISRQCYHLHRLLISKKLKIDQKEKEYIEGIEGMFELLQKSYLTKDLSYLTTLHEKEQELVYEKGLTMLRKGNPAKMHYLMYLARLVYLTNSPLTGIIQMQSLQK